MTETAPPGNATARVEIVVRGRVQGVGYRMFAARVAAGYRLTGWVANEPDGAVRSVAEGPREVLEAFARELAAGPPGADVIGVSVTWSAALDGFDRFAIRSGWHGGD
jgi:acylphosphatase